MRARAAVAGWVFAVSAGMAVAQPGPLDRTEQDKRTARVVYESALLGSDLFNKKNHEGCFRLYQGTLLAVQPMLDHRPKLAAFVKDRLDKAAPLNPVDGSLVLREALDAVQAETATALAPAKKAVPLWDRLGGEKAVRVVVKDFVAAAAADPKVNITRGGKYKLDAEDVARLEKGVVEYVSQVTGGSLKYGGEGLAVVAAGRKITDAEFNAMAVHLVTTMQKHKVPQNETLELLEIVGATRREVVGK